MAVDVVTEITITRPRDEVSAFAADPSNATAWYKNIKAVEWDTPPPVVVGSRVRFRAQFLGRTLEYTYEVREFEPGRRFVMATAQGPFPMETAYTWRSGRFGGERSSWEGDDDAAAAQVDEGDQWPGCVEAEAAVADEADAAVEAFEAAVV